MPRQVTNSVGEALVLDPAFDWGDDDFRAPAWNAMTIYELHVGTFTPGPSGEPGDFDLAVEKLRPPGRVGRQHDPGDAAKRVPRRRFVGL